MSGALPPDRVDRAQSWRRLSPRMLLVHPVQEVLQFLPALFGVVILGRANDGMPWWFEIVFVAIPVLLGISRWFTTSYTIGQDTIRLRTGLLQRKTLTANLERVRTVDAVAPPLHRLLGLVKVMIGTGADKPFELNGLRAAEARSLRAELLHRGVGPAVARPAPGSEVPASPTDSPSMSPRTSPATAQWTTEQGPRRPVEPQGSLTGAGDQETVLGRFRPAWVLLAPFTLSGLLGVVAVSGFLGQYSGAIVRRISDSEGGANLMGYLQGLGFWLAAVQVGIAVLATVAALSMISYTLAYWGYRLTRHPGGTLHVTRGLLTTRATSLDEARIRGARLVEPYLMRLVSGAKAIALTTGFNRTEDGVNLVNNLLTPPAPRAVVNTVTAAVLGGDAPLTVGLTEHGPAARRRRHIRALAVGLLVLVLVAWARTIADWPAWVLVPAVVLVVSSPALAEQRYHSLGHALVGDYLVARADLFPRERSMLRMDGVIGWTVSQTLFQRRAGLVSLHATTAAGSGQVSVTDVPQSQGLAVIGAVSPGLLAQFVQAPEAGPGR